MGKISLPSSPGQSHFTVLQLHRIASASRVQRLEDLCKVRGGRKDKTARGSRGFPPRGLRLSTVINLKSSTTGVYSTVGGIASNNQDQAISLSLAPSNSNSNQFKLCHCSCLPFTDRHVGAPGPRRGKGTDVGTPDYYSDYRNQV